MKTLLTKSWNWFVKSSADPNKIALTVKGGVPLIISIAWLFGAELPEESLTEALVSLTVVVSAIVTAVGACRKVWLTAKRPVA